MHYKTRVFHNQTHIEYVITLAFSNTLSIVFITLLITFVSLTIIYRIKELRYVGIKLIAGEKLQVLMLKSILLDGCTIGIASSISFIIGYLLLYQNGQTDFPLISLLITAIFVYALVLLGISASLSLLYLFGRKKSGLMEIIKGKLPLKRLLAILLIGQLVAVFGVGFGISRMNSYNQLLNHQLSSDKEWNKQSNWVKLSFYLSNPLEDTHPRWMNFLTDAVENHNALLVKHNLTHFISKSSVRGNLTINDYHPDANTLYVTPNYFDVQSIGLDDPTKTKLNSLQTGQFGLILPEKLKNQTEHYQKIYTDFMNNLGIKNTTETPANLKAVIGYLPNHQKYFIFNQSAASTRQYLEDSIIVVITPQSTYNLSGYTHFWKSTLDTSLYLLGHNKTIDLLKKHGVFHLVTHVENARLLYYEQVDNIKLDTIMAIAGGFLGILTSLILFNAMNFLYFEQFRRDIFIKRIAGMHFLELHQIYLLTQFVVLLLGFSAIQFFTGHLIISALTLSLFTINSLLTLYYQIKKEERTSITVLKGK